MEKFQQNNVLENRLYVALATTIFNPKEDIVKAGQKSPSLQVLFKSLLCHMDDYCGNIREFLKIKNSDFKENFLKLKN